MQVKEGQKRRTEGEQGSAEFKRLTLQGRNNKVSSHGASGTAAEGEQGSAEFKRLTLQGRNNKVSSHGASA
eukprot:CAMPEP_0185791338 /NCGR_PEP_ID=MMETSP1174-20130828/158321_1 /TAXON_ID=35687 /ORGANISM="Dictyocha speculum, Strain CCMP1381" /LENGTH=70 /DNA_ID=CAMNT_0028486281 /DNA_START=221 /DNA_END=433 /DNA_ORIENTATION=+